MNHIRTPTLLLHLFFLVASALGSKPYFTAQTEYYNLNYTYSQDGSEKDLGVAKTESLIVQGICPPERLFDLLYVEKNLIVSSFSFLNKEGALCKLEAVCKKDPIGNIINQVGGQEPLKNEEIKGKQVVQYNPHKKVAYFTFFTPVNVQKEKTSEKAIPVSDGRGKWVLILTAGAIVTLGVLYILNDNENS